MVEPCKAHAEFLLPSKPLPRAFPQKPAYLLPAQSPLPQVHLVKGPIPGKVLKLDAPAPGSCSVLSHLPPLSQDSDTPSFSTGCADLPGTHSPGALPHSTKAPSSLLLPQNQLALYPNSLIHRHQAWKVQRGEGPAGMEDSAGSGGVPISLPYVPMAGTDET